MTRDTYKGREFTSKNVKVVIINGTEVPVSPEADVVDPHSLLDAAGFPPEEYELRRKAACGCGHEHMCEPLSEEISVEHEEVLLAQPRPHTVDAD